MKNKNIINWKISGFVAVLTCSLLWNGVVWAEAEVNVSETFLSRGEATNMVVRYFDLERQNYEFLNNCIKNPEECLFSFKSRTNWEEVRSEPMILYPDVFPANKYYEAINIATQLDLVRGYYQEENSPYKPFQNISRIEALKLVMGASGLVEWKDKFEFSLPGEKDTQENWLIAGNWSGEQWWYGRYLYNAMTRELIDDIKDFQADKPITRQEMQRLMERTKDYLPDGQSLVDKYGQADQEANTSANS